MMTKTMTSFILLQLTPVNPFLSHATSSTPWLQANLRCNSQKNANKANHNALASFGVSYVHEIQTQIEVYLQVNTFMFWIQLKTLQYFVHIFIKNITITIWVKKHKIFIKWFILLSFKWGSKVGEETKVSTLNDYFHWMNWVFALM